MRTAHASPAPGGTGRVRSFDPLTESRGIRTNHRRRVTLGHLLVAPHPGVAISRVAERAACGHEDWWGLIRTRHCAYNEKPRARNQEVKIHDKCY